MNSGDFTGMRADEAIGAIADWLAERGLGKRAVNYRLARLARLAPALLGLPDPGRLLRARRGRARAEDQLPVLLPDVEDYAPKGKSPLAAAEDWVATECPRCGGPARRETDTMDTFVDSSWYFIRYLDPHDSERRVGPRGGRLLDARRPVHRRRRARDPPPHVRALLHQGARATWASSGVQEPFASLFTQGMITRDGAKMSSSKGNVVSAADTVARYGADTARTYVCFIGPPEQDGDWTDEGVEGVHRFLSRLWRLCERGRRANGARRVDASERPRGAPRDLARQGALGDRQGHPRHRARLPVPHRDRRRDGARQRGLPAQGRALRRSGGRGGAALRDGDRRLADLPVRAPPRRRGLRGARGRARLGGAVARGRCGAARERHVHAGRPGQREAPRPASRPRSTPARPSCSSSPAQPKPCSAISTARRSSRRSSCPGKLVNLVVR